MRDYIKPFIEDEEVELEDIVAASNTTDLDDNWHNVDDDFFK